MTDDDDVFRLRAPLNEPLPSSIRISDKTVIGRGTSAVAEAAVVNREDVRVESGAVGFVAVHPEVGGPRACCAVQVQDSGVVLYGIPEDVFGGRR